MRFKKTRRGIEAAPDEVELAVLRRCAQDLLVLLGDGSDVQPQADRPDPVQSRPDPLEALLGLPPGDAVRPEDPALARLLPDAYPREDPEASREFRRYTEGELRAGKRAHCATVLATLPASGKLHLDRDQADAWLGCLNDLRLVLGTRLGVTEDLDRADLDDQDPRAQALQVYGWLGWLQESLLSCLSPRG